MIPQITEVKDKFPEYATLSQATVTLNDMGDRTISAQVKIDGNIVPDFSFDWEVEFKGERYIQPLRQPQASKGYESKCSVIDLTFYHKTIYDLKRYFFIEMATTKSGTAMADKYIADLNVNIKQFKVALQDVLDFYYKDENRIIVSLYGEDTDIYAQEPQYVKIQYTHIWDVVQKIYDLFGVRWSIEGREIKIGYPTDEVAHIFEYGFDGGLLKVERQVQSADIRNSLLGRGGSKNLPYLYFKDLDKYGETGENGTWTPDPDAIPELRNIYFTELRGKTFRDYVQGWKTNPNRDLSYGDIVEEYDTERGESPEGWAYKAGHEDKTFNPIEYVEDKESITKYGLLQGGLDNQEDIYPSIQDVEVDGIGRVDEIVGAEKVIVDESEDNESYDYITLPINEEFSGDQLEATEKKDEYIFRSNIVHRSLDGYVGYFNSNPIFKTSTNSISIGGVYQGSSPYIYAKTEIISYKIIDADSGQYLKDIVSIPSGIRFKVEYRVFHKVEIQSGWHITGVSINSDWHLSNNPLRGEVLENLNEDGTRKNDTISIEKNDTSIITLLTDKFEVDENGATNVDVPVNVITENHEEGLYEWKRYIEAVNTETNEVSSSINIPKGKYYLRVKVEITNNSTSTQTYKVELLPSYIIYPTDYEEFKPTFDIWVKNIWNTTRNAGESEQAYVDRVWSAILGDREGNKAKVVFTTGWLAGHSDYEFVIRNVEYAGGSGVELGGVPAEWKITLIKSDAELEATGKWIPSTTQQAVKGDKFFFIGIDMPHEYTLWAEQRVDNFKTDQLLETAHIKPTWVVQTDKVRLNQLQPNETEPLLNALKIGNSLRLADTRFTNGVAQTLYLQSVTYTWQEGTNIVPDVEVVLSDKVVTSTNPVAKLQGEVDAIAKQVGSIANIQQVVRSVGDKLYLRKDGLDDVSNSPTEFTKLVSSKGFQQGQIAGKGWGLRIENGESIIEADTLVARNKLIVNTIVANQVSSIGGEYIISAANIECTKVEDLGTSFRCFFDKKQGTIANLFVVRDIAYSQVFDNNNNSIKYYKREVVGVGSDYIDLSKTNYDGSGVPQEGDIILHFGNFEDNTRQGFIVISSIPKPTLSQYEGVNSFHLPTPSTRISPSNSKFTGKVAFEAGSYGLENIEEWAEKQGLIDSANKNAADALQLAAESEENANSYTDDAISKLVVSGQNLLANSGFTGDYISTGLEPDDMLSSDSEMFSSKLAHWDNNNVVIQESVDSQSGYEASLTEGYLKQTLFYKIIEGESYVLSFKAKGNAFDVSVGGFSRRITPTTEYIRYVEKFIAQSSDSLFAIENATCTICEIQLERGTMVSEWGNSPLDNSSGLAYYQATKYLTNALKNGSTQINGGLLLSNMMMLGNASLEINNTITSGVSGIKNDDTDVAFWGGGTYEQAIATILKYVGNPSYQPSEEEWGNMAKFVVTHGGDVFMRGYIHALGGYFAGEVNIAGGKIRLNQDGSGHLAGGRYSWDKNGASSVSYPDRIKWVDFSELVNTNGQEIPIDQGGYIKNVISYFGTIEYVTMPKNCEIGTSFTISTPPGAGRNHNGIYFKCDAPNSFRYGDSFELLNQIYVDSMSGPFTITFSLEENQVWSIRVDESASINILEMSTPTTVHAVDCYYASYISSGKLADLEKRIAVLEQAIL